MKFCDNKVHNLTDLIKDTYIQRYPTDALCENCLKSNYVESRKLSHTDKLLLVQLKIFTYNRSAKDRTKHKCYLTLRKKTKYLINKKKLQSCSSFVPYLNSAHVGLYITRVLYNNEKIITCNDEIVEEHKSNDF